MDLRGRSFSGKIMGYQEWSDNLTDKLQKEVAEAQGYGKQWLKNRWQQSQKDLSLAASHLGRDVAEASMAPLATSHGEAVGESVWSKAKPWVIGGGVIFLALVGYGIYKVKS